jgi:hypothetical protein
MTTISAGSAPAPGGGIISESGGEIISEQRGGFVGIGIVPAQGRINCAFRKVRTVIPGSSAYLVQVVGFTDGANTFIRLKLQSTV